MKHESYCENFFLYLVGSFRHPDHTVRLRGKPSLSTMGRMERELLVHHHFSVETFTCTLPA